MEAATRTRATASERELALKLGTLVLHCLGGRGGDVFRVVDESGLSFAQMKALVTLEAPDQLTEPTVTGLSESLGISAASASRAADGLVKRRLASRVEDPHDRRVRRLALTAKGRELADRIISARLAGLEDFTGSLNGTERRQLSSALETLMERDELAEIYRSYEKRVGR